MSRGKKAKKPKRIVNKNHQWTNVESNCWERFNTPTQHHSTSLYIALQMLSDVQCNFESILTGLYEENLYYKSIKIPTSMGERFMI